MSITKRSLFYWILHRQRPLQFLLLGIILTSLFFKVFPLEMQKRIINTAIHLKKEQLLFLYCGLYIGAVTIAGLLKYAINVLQVRIGQKILVDIRQELYAHVLQLPTQFYRTVQPGTVISAMGAELNAIGFFLGGALTIPLTSILTFLTFLGFMVSLSPLLALLSVGIYPLEMIVIPYLQKKYNRLNKQRVKTTRAMGNVVNEAISGIHEVHGNASYHLEEQKLGAFIHKLFAILQRLFTVKFGIKFANNLFQSFGPFILFLVGGYLAIHGQFTIGALVAFLSAYEKVYDPWKELLEYYQAMQDAQVRYKQIMEVFDEEPDFPLLPDNRDTYDLQGKIELNNAGFTVGRGIKLLDRINMHIKPNEQVALVGFSGSGKSTLAMCISQLYKATSGNISIDDYNLETLTREDIRRNFAIIAQQPFIFSGTLRENLLYSVNAAGKKDGDQAGTDRSQLLQVVRDVGLEGDIIRFGLDSVIPKERIGFLKRKILQMRHIIGVDLEGEFSKAIEFYDANSFLYYASLRDNLIFGDSIQGDFQTKNLINHDIFMNLLKETGLDPQLLDLGLVIAKQTVELLRDIGADDYFFQGSPMHADEFEWYTALLDRLDGAEPTKTEDKNRLYILAFRFIPGRHNIVRLPDGLAENILNVRHRFLETIVKLDIDKCRTHADFSDGFDAAAILPQYSVEQDFIPYCATEYIITHSVLDNILFGVVKSEDTHSHDVLRNLAFKTFKKKGLLDDIMDIGLDFDVGSKGDRLSGGQKQKVAIARAFLKDAPILIMDEATSALDNQSQAHIQHFIETQYKGKKTIIAVIHRLDLTPSYDRIFVLKTGKIIEHGTYDELMTRKGAFYELAQGNK